MANIIDYCESELRPFTEHPFSEVDSLVLSQLAYIQFENAVPARMQRLGAPTLRDLYRAELFAGMFAGIRVPQLNRALPHVIETYHEGDLPAVYSGLAVDAENISVGALKRAEDDNGYILRVVETTGKATKTTLAAPMFGRNIELNFGAMEIKTLFVPDEADAPVKEVMITEW